MPWAACSAVGRLPPSSYALGRQASSPRAVGCLSPSSRPVSRASPPPANRHRRRGGRAPPAVPARAAGRRPSLSAVAPRSCGGRARSPGRRVSARKPQSRARGYLHPPPRVIRRRATACHLSPSSRAVGRLAPSPRDVGHLAPSPRNEVDRGPPRALSARCWLPTTFLTLGRIAPSPHDVGHLARGGAEVSGWTSRGRPEASWRAIGRFGPSWRVTACRLRRVPRAA